MKKTVLKAQARQGTGSRVSRKARAAGFTPVNVYGHGLTNQALSISTHDLDIALHSPAQVFLLDIDGHEESCLVKEVQYDTFGQLVLHVDFARIDLSEEVNVEVHLDFLGTPVGVAKGGAHMVLHPALPVLCRADSIPDAVQVDVSALDIGAAVHAGEIALPQGVRLDEHAIDGDEPVFHVTAPHKEEPTPVEAEGEGEAAAPTEAKPEGDES